jgi:hypothetical protein
VSASRSTDPIFLGVTHPRGDGKNGLTPTLTLRGYSMGEIITGVAVLVVYGVADVLERVLIRKALWTPPNMNPEGNLEIRYPFALRVINTVMAAIVTGIGLSILVLVVPRGDIPLIGALLGATFFLAAGALGLWVTGAVLVNRVVLRPEGLEARGLGDKRLIYWTHARVVDCWDIGPFWKWITVRDATQVIRAPLHSRGALQLYREARIRVPRDYWRDTYDPIEEMLGAMVGNTTPAAGVAPQTGTGSTVEASPENVLCIPCQDHTPRYPGLKT